MIEVVAQKPIKRPGSQVFEFVADMSNNPQEAVIRGDSSRLFRIAEPLMKIMVNRNVQADYRRLKALLEA